MNFLAILFLNFASILNRLMATYIPKILREKYNA